MDGIRESSIIRFLTGFFDSIFGSDSRSEFEDCGLTDDDLVDLAECFDNRGRDSITSL